jgi:ornithine cyclodeaminase/alanine dehydrogenase-like protein (mu-crystallin family)
LDFDSYWKPEAMHSMTKFCTDDREQLAHYKTLGYFSDIPEVYADLGEIVSGKKQSRKSSGERTMAMNLGLAIEDIASAILIYEKATRTRAGTKLAL